MCTGRIDPAFIVRAFSNGMDGVFIGGCWPGECHYPMEGNYHALSMVLLTRKLLKHIGMNPERLRLEWVSAAQGIRFAEVINDVVRNVKELGPIGKGEGIDENGLKFKLEAIRNLLPYIKMVERERLRVPVDTEVAYEEFFASDEVDRLFHELIVDPLVMSQIMLLLREKPLSAGEISATLGLNSSEASRFLNRSSRQGFIRFDESQKRFVPVRSDRAGVR
jgi:coenzyme F420-reducing hydrogenase delta subunit